MNQQPAIQAYGAFGATSCDATDKTVTGHSAVLSPPTMGSYGPWTNGEPDNDRSGAFQGSEWRAWPCGNVENWICETQ